MYTFSSYEAVNALHMHFYGTHLSNGRIYDIFMTEQKKTHTQNNNRNLEHKEGAIKNYEGNVLMSMQMP